jgi:hypothetical protein
MDRAQWIFAFPTTGKTTLARQVDKFIDLDSADVRRALAVEKGDEEGEKVVAESVIAAARFHIDRGKVVLNNDPALYSAAASRYNVILVVPSYGKDELFRRAANRGEPTFADRLFQNSEQWIENWKQKGEWIAVDTLASALGMASVSDKEVRDAMHIDRFPGAHANWLARIRNVLIPGTSRIVIRTTDRSIADQLLIKGINADAEWDYVDAMVQRNAVGPYELQAIWRAQWVQRIHGTHVLLAESDAFCDWSRCVGYQVYAVGDERWDIVDYEFNDQVVTSKWYAHGAWEPVRLESVDNYADDKRRFGNWIRSTVMGFVSRSGRRYIGVGDEAESIVMAYNLRIESSHYNVRYPTPLNETGLSRSNNEDRDAYFCYEVLMWHKGGRKGFVNSRSEMIHVMNTGHPVTWIHGRSRQVSKMTLPREVLWTYVPYADGLMAATWWPGAKGHKTSPIYRNSEWYRTGNDDMQSKAIIEQALILDDSWRSIDGIVVSLFAISNISNYDEMGRNDDLERIRKRDHVVLLPFAGAVNFWQDDYGIQLSNTKRGVELTDRDFVDMCHWPKDGVSWNIPTSMWAMRKFYGISEYGDLHIANQKDDHGWDPSDGLCSLWYIETNMLPWSEKQTMLSMQTHHVKYWTGIMREVWHHDNRTLHTVRSLAVQRQGGIPLNDGRINGILRGRPVTVAGHLVNLLLASHYTPIDFGRWLATIRGNIKGYPAKALFEDVERHELWHSMDEWLLAIDTYHMMAEAIGLVPRNQDGLREAIREVFRGNEMRDGREVAEYLSDSRLPTEYNGRKVMYGSKVERRTKDELLKLRESGETITLVDGARIKDLILFEPLPGGHIGVHAKRGVHDGKPFNETRNPESQLATMGDWILMRQEGHISKLYFKSLEV